MNQGATAPLLSLRAISKAYGHIQALVDVDFELLRGEIVALVGDNGAGKSTLVKTLAGIHQPDAGEYLIEGRRVSFGEPRDAYRHGVATVFQDLALVEALDVARNMCLGREPARLGWVNRRKMVAEAESVFQSLGIKVPSMRTTVALLSGGQRQGVAIARAVLRGGSAVVMDEPTAALGVRETAQVLEIIRRLKAQGRGVVIVSHNLDLVFDVSDRIQVLRLGRTAGARVTAETSHEEVVGLITGGLARLTSGAKP